MNLAQELEKHVRTLSEKIGERSVYEVDNLLKTKQYIVSELESYGYQPNIYPYTVRDDQYENIEAILPGKDKRNILFGAHYDSSPGSPGADDNASGVAGLLALAKKQAGLRPAKTLTFAFFANEERPYGMTENMGSLVYARELARKNILPEKVLILEMLGYFSDQNKSQRYPFPLNYFYPNRGDFMGVISNFRNIEFVFAVGRLLGQHFPVEKLAAPPWIRDGARSDHWSFWKVGVPALMLTDTANFRNKNYHTATDTWDTLNYEKMGQFIEALLQILPRL